MEGALGTALETALLVVATAAAAVGGEGALVAVVVPDAAAAEQVPGDGVNAAEVELVVVGVPYVVDVAVVEPHWRGALVLGADLAVAEKHSAGSEEGDNGGEYVRSDYEIMENKPTCW